MTRKILPLLAIVWMVLGWTVLVNADLLPRLGGSVVYDTDIDVTWMSDANLAATNTFGVSGISTNPGIVGAAVWNTANAWITAMNAANYLGFSDWRLPTTLIPDTNCTDDTTGTIPSVDSRGWNCTGSEMGHLFYNELGGIAGQSILTSGDPNLNLFTNIRTGGYSSDTEFALSLNAAWGFSQAGSQAPVSKALHLFLWAVRDGDPEAPAAAVSETAVTKLSDIVSVVEVGVPDVGDLEKALKALNKVSVSLLASLNSFQPTDPSRLIVNPALPDGTDFFGHIKDAVKKTYTAVDKGLIINSSLLDQLQRVVANNILFAAKRAAQVAINDAINTVGITNQDVIRAQIDLETGNQLTNNGINVGISALAFFDEAMKSYGHAWEFAQQALGTLPAE